MADSAAYRIWAANVGRDGGVATTLPKTAIVAARYPSEVWRERVNRGQWRTPDMVVGPPKGQTRIQFAPGRFTDAVAYYTADRDVQASGAGLRLATEPEIAIGAGDIQDQWLASLSALARDFGKQIVFGVVVALLIRWLLTRDAKK